MILGMAGGYILGRLKLENLLTPWVKDILLQKSTNLAQEDEKALSFRQRFPSVMKEAWSIVKSVFIYIIIGIGIGGIIHGFVPTEFFEAYIGKSNPFAVPLAVILGAPMYANPAGIVPIVGALITKGVPMGTALAFMMSVIAISLPEALMLKKVMTLKLMAYFFGIVLMSIILSGYIFNILL
jgi:uncharacterized membrane protein YraQ (UPF0718 family)